MFDLNWARFAGLSLLSNGRSSSMGSGVSTTFLILTVTCLLPVSIPAEEGARKTSSELSMNAAVQMSLSRHHLRGEYKAKKRKAKANVEAARQFSNPSFSVEHEHGFDDSQGTENYFILEQEFPIAGRSGQIDAAKQRKRAELLDIQASEIRVASRVREYWIAWTAACRKHAKHRNYIERLEEGKRIVKNRVNAGESSPVHRSRINAKLAEARVTSSEAEAGCRSAWLKLHARLGASKPEEMPEPIGKLIVRPRGIDNLSEAVAQIEKLPDVKSEDSRIEAIDLEAESVANSAWPDPTIAAGYRHIRTPLGSDPGFVAGISLPLPLWHQRGGEAAALEAEAARLRHAKRRRQKKLRARLKALWQKAEASTQRIKQFRKQGIHSAERAAKQAETAYHGGEVTLTDYLDAVRALLDAELQSIELRKKAALEWNRVRSMTTTKTPKSSEYVTRRMESESSSETPEDNQ